MSSTRRLPKFSSSLSLLVSYCALLLYGTLKPFRFTWQPAPYRLIEKSRIEWVPFSNLCPDYGIFCPHQTGLNIAIFIPVGALVALTAARILRPMRRVVHATAIGFILSLCIETTQYFIPARFPSSTDLILNTFGAALGGTFVALLVRSSRPAVQDQVSSDSHS